MTTSTDRTLWDKAWGVKPQVALTNPEPKLTMEELFIRLKAVGDITINEDYVSVRLKVPETNTQLETTIWVEKGLTTVQAMQMIYDEAASVKKAVNP